MALRNTHLLCKGVEVGSNNHSNVTLLIIKDVVANEMREKLCNKFKTKLSFADKPNPVSEVVDKMTHEYYLESSW